MSATRNVELRPLTARSALLSLLLGTRPPFLPSRVLVRAGALFGISEGTVRTALSRMQASGEIEAFADGYRLRGRLLERQARLTAGRHPELRSWRGAWRMAVVASSGRTPKQREALRRGMASLRLAELREGVWLRPDNLRAEYVAEHCEWFVTRPEQDSKALAASLWDLDDWAGRAVTFMKRIDAMVGPLAKGDTDVLADGFVWSAAVLRHFEADPLLPDELAPAGWPSARLRERYDEFDAAYRSLLASWLREATGR